MAVVSESLDRLLGGGSLGRDLELGGESYRVVGISGDIKSRSLDEQPRAVAYLPLAQRYEPTVAVQVRAATGDARRLLREVRSAIWGLDAAVPLYDAEHLGDRVAASRSHQQITFYLMALCGVASLVLSMSGIYGLTAKQVAGRSREIAIRLALGARREETVGLVMRRGVVLAVAGIGLGVVVALWLGRFLESRLFGVTARDPLVFAAAGLVCLVVATLAAFVPARRVIALDPAPVLAED